MSRSFLAVLAIAVGLPFLILLALVNSASGVSSSVFTSALGLVIGEAQENARPQYRLIHPPHRPGESTTGLAVAAVVAGAGGPLVQLLGAQHWPATTCLVRGPGPPGERLDRRPGEGDRI